MIEASFGSGSRGAAVSGAYQYDTGQRLRMYGLPSPQELAERDDFLAGDVVMVQAQYAFAGDSQTETRIALWDEELCAWTAAVPDVYLKEHDDVRVYIYVGYGQTDEAMRTKTMYEAVFRPNSRPAPGDSVTPAQLNAWDALAQEVNLALANAGKAESNANAAAQEAREAGERLDNMTASAETGEPGSEADVEVLTYSDRKHLVFRIPRGDKGEQGEPGLFEINGYRVENSAKIHLTYKDVGAMPEKARFSKVATAVVDMSEFSVDEDGWFCTAAQVDGVLASDDPVADLDLADLSTQEAEQAKKLYGMIDRIETGDGLIQVFCTEDPSACIEDVSEIAIRLLIV